MIMLFKVLIFVFSALLLYQIIVSLFKGTVREGLLASSDGAYTLENARQDIVEHDKRIVSLEAQVKTNSDAIADLMSKSKNIEGFCEGMLASESPPYTTANENMDIADHEQRIHVLQGTVKQNINDMGIVNKKLGLVPANQYSNTDLIMISGNDAKSKVVAHDKEIGALEEVVRKNVVDINELQRQLKENADKYGGAAQEITSKPMPVISGTV